MLFEILNLISKNNTSILFILSEISSKYLEKVEADGCAYVSPIFLLKVCNFFAGFVFSFFFFIVGD